MAEDVEKVLDAFVAFIDDVTPRFETLLNRLTVVENEYVEKNGYILEGHPLASLLDAFEVKYDAFIKLVTREI